MRSVVIATFLFACLGLAQTAKTSNPQPNIADMKNELDSIRSSLAALKRDYFSHVASGSDVKGADLGKQISDLKSSVDTLWDQFNNTRGDVWKLQSEDSVSFDPASATGFQPLNSEAGRFLVLLSKAEPYLTGYRVYLQIGNLTSARLTHYVLSFEWSHNFKYKEETFDKWDKGKKALTLEPSAPLEPGKWNSLNVVLPGTELKDFEYLRIKMETKGVSLGSN